MFSLFSKFSFYLLVILSISSLHLHDVRVLAADSEDEIDNEPVGTAATEEDAETVVETDDGEEIPDSSSVEKGEEEPEEQVGLKMSPDVETQILFPAYTDKQLPAGKPIHALVGFTNKGSNSFVIDTLDASFRYPQDFSYYIQNFTGYRYERLIEPGQEATFEYAFHPHESYGGRPFGLVLMMMYKNAEGDQFGGAVFNETITFQEVEEGFDGETFFLYVFLAAIGILVVFGLNFALKSMKITSSQSGKSFETGTQQQNGIDFEWLPKETTTEFGKQSPRRSPRSRKARRAEKAAEE